MNITATGTSSLTSLYLQQLLGSGGNTLLQASSGEETSDTVSISSAAQQAASGQDPFQADLASLEEAIASGDAAKAKAAYQTMADKLKQHGEIPSDFAAIGTALDAGDLTAASTAVDQLKQRGPGQGGNPPPPPPGGGTNPLKADLDQLGELLESGDTGSAKTLFSSILDKLQSNAGGSSGTSSSDSLSASADALTQALSAGDTTSASAAWKHLLEQMQAQQGPLARSLASVAASAYTTAASAI